MQRLSRLLLLLLSLLALGVLTAHAMPMLGWLPWNGIVQVSPISAINFLMAILVLLLPGGNRAGAARALLSMIIMLLAALTLGMEINQILSSSTASFPAKSPLQMTWNSALLFLLSGLALLLMDRVRSRHGEMLMQVLLFVIFGLSSFALVGHLLDVQFLYTLRHSQMSALAALGFILLSVSLYLACLQRGCFANHAKEAEAQRISLIGGLVLAAVALLSGLGVFKIFDSHFRQALENSLALSLQGRMQVVENTLAQAHQISRMIASRPVLVRLAASAAQGDVRAREQLHQAAQSFLPTGFGSFVFEDVQGQVLVKAGHLPAREQELAIPLAGPNAGVVIWQHGWHYSTRLPLREGLRTVGHVRMDIPLSAIDRLFANNFGLGRTGEMVICGPRVVTGGVDPQFMECMPHRFRPQGAPTPYMIDDTPLPMTYAMQGRTAVIKARDYRRQEVIDAFAPIGKTGLGMVLKIDRAELYAPVSRQMQLLMPLLLAIILGGILLLRRLTLPLLLAMVQSEAQTRESNERLHQSEERYRSVVESAREGIVTADSSNRIIYMNAAAGQMFGHDPQAMHGQIVSLLMPARFRSPHESHLQRFVNTGQGGIMGTLVEVTGLRKSGEEFPMELSLTYWESPEGMFFTSIMRDISERKAVERLKDEFVSTVSHELRTPLTSIRGSLGLLHGGVAGELPAQSKQLLNIALSNSERLSNLINDILDIEKLESGKFDLKLQKLPLAPLLRQAVSENAGYASTYDCKLVLQEPLLETQVRVDPDRFMQILANLLSNATKFSPKGGQVSVLTEHTSAGQVRITVCDQGPGVPDSFQSRIFQKFAQADASDTRSKGGTGLGLSISKALAQAMQGVIGFANRPEGGACFHIELPSLEKVPERTTPGLGRILICEDDPDVAHLLSLMLREGGYACDLAFSAGQAKQYLATGKYAAMTLDIMLPDQDGISFLRELRTLEATRHLPVVVVSAKAATGKQELNGDAFAIVDWLSKPIDQQRLLGGLHQALRYSTSEKHCILHIEDDPDIRQLIAIMLGDEAEVVAARDATQARQAMAARHYHLVILDLGLPDDPGTQLLGELREYQPLTPVLVFSSQEPTHELTEQVAGLLIKSLTSHQVLLDTIRALLHQQVSLTTAETSEEAE